MKNQKILLFLLLLMADRLVLDFQDATIKMMATFNKQQAKNLFLSLF